MPVMLSVRSSLCHFGDFVGICADLLRRIHFSKHKYESVAIFSSHLLSPLFPLSRLTVAVSLFGNK